MDELRQLDGFINIHADLTDADLDILRYPGADSACDAASSLPDSSTVFKVNEVCGTSANLEDWKNTVVAHEEAHQTSLNKCISDQRTQTEITEMANLVENDEAKLQSDLTKRWNLLLGKFDVAMKGNLSGESTNDVHNYRNSQRWTTSTNFAGHRGTDGCPP